MPDCLDADCTRNSKEERRDGGIMRRHCRRAQHLYETIRADLLAEDYETAASKVETAQEPCPHCGHRPVFGLTYPDFYLDPSGFAILESGQRSSRNHIHQAPTDYPPCLVELTFVNQDDGLKITIPTYQQIAAPAGAGPHSRLYTLPLRAAVTAQRNGTAPEATPVTGCDMAGSSHCDAMRAIADSIFPERDDEESAHIVSNYGFRCQELNVFIQPQLAVLRLQNGTAAYCLVEQRADAAPCIHICCL